MRRIQIDNIIPAIQCTDYSTTIIIPEFALAVGAGHA
jgi:hypothetical protein